MSSGVPSAEDISNISIIRESVLEFLTKMMNEKMNVESQIREKTEEIKTEFTQMGKSSYTYGDISDLSAKYRDFFLEFYKNSIHMRLVATASHYIREGIESAFVKADLVKEEVLREFQRLQEIISEQMEKDARLTDYERQLMNQTETYSDLQSENIRLNNEITALRAELNQKNEEIENLSLTLKQMEDQVNVLGSRMLESSGDMEEMQMALAERDNIIAHLRNENRQALEKLQEMEQLRQTIKELTERERELLSRQSSVSNEFIEDLQKKYENAQNELFALKSKEVESREEIRRMKLDLEGKQLQIQQLEEENSTLKSQVENLKTKIQSLEKENLELRKKIEENQNVSEELKKLNSRVALELENAKEKLKQYEGKVSLSQEEKEQMEAELKDLRSKVTENEASLEYLKGLLIYDQKYRALAIIESLGTELRMRDLAKSLNLPLEIVHRVIIELADNGLIAVRRDGNVTYIRPIEEKRSPFSLEYLLAEV
ncbi:MAG: hypothetical protein D6732_13960 [Methanobacteriota archaeon]|nr:MAG: hypothetical protein D6732_13960 [Euryarchaeota archaeon]